LRTYLFLTLIIKNAYNVRHFVADVKLTNINDINQYKLTIFWSFQLKIVRL